MTRTVQIKIIDLLYENKLCNLVYMRDTTSLSKRQPEVRDSNKTKFFDLFLQDTAKFQANLEKYLQDVTENDGLSVQTC